MRFGAALEGSSQKRPKWILLVAIVIAAMPALSGCGSIADTVDPPQCSGNLHPYKRSCLTNTAIVYLECTKGKGLSTTTELGGAAGGTFRVVAGASVKLAYKKSRQEDRPVALKIVQDCLKIAEEASDSAVEKNVARSLGHQVDQDLENFEKQQVKATPHIRISPSSAAIGQKVRVRGTTFWANETVDVYVHASLVKQVQASSKGAFATEITVPSDAPPPSFATTIRASGETSAASASAPFHTRTRSGGTKGNSIFANTGSGTPQGSDSKEIKSPNCSIETTGIAQLHRSKDPTGSGERIPAGTYPVISVSEQPWVGSDIQWFKISVDGRLGYVEDDAAEVASRSASCP